ncbi:hypothetical protein HMPREF9123_0604 [Neisseria bacilliformis ATCC BAA-1200]|uniref:Uncharacterized protein n=1 Tax=Neisseria bacilliformis ATCC BAA-1200 TaxID=888742 RepID=F2BA50_9NEIS|nr:hypothetical protein HMPREF9123_0604 [Neisseria bacilliformis ATCC BAA-1200]
MGKLWASGKNPLPATARAALPKKHTNYKTFKIKQIKQNPHQRPSEKSKLPSKTKRWKNVHKTRLTDPFPARAAAAKTRQKIFRRPQIRVENARQNPPFHATICHHFLTNPTTKERPPL